MNIKKIKKNIKIIEEELLKNKITKNTVEWNTMQNLLNLIRTIKINFNQKEENFSLKMNKKITTDIFWRISHKIRIDFFIIIKGLTAYGVSTSGEKICKEKFKHNFNLLDLKIFWKDDLKNININIIHTFENDDIVKEMQTFLEKYGIILKRQKKE